MICLDAAADLSDMLVYFLTEITSVFHDAERKRCYRDGSFVSI